MQQILGGTYQILNPIGSGSGGTVYKGYHLRLQKYIVLKKIHREIRDKSREMEILKCLKEGMSDSEIAEKFYISKNTVRFHVSNLLKKTNSSSRVHAVQSLDKFSL